MPPSRYSQAFLISWLRERLKRHNRHVLTFTGLSLLGAMVGWGALYSVAYWLVLLAFAIIRGPYATLPAGFPLAFAAIAGTLIFSAWVDRRLTPNARPRDSKEPIEIAMDFFLAIPRMTLAITANFSARVKLSPSDLSAAALLIERLSGTPRILLQQAPLEIPEQNTRDKVLNALLLLEIIEFQREPDLSIWLKVTPAAKRSLGEPALEYS